MERGDGGGGMAPRGGVVGSGAMLGLDMHLAQQRMHQAAAFQHQQDSHNGGFQLQQPSPVAVRQQQPPPSSFVPYSTNTSSSRVVVSAAAVGHDDEMVGNGGGGKGGVVVQQQQQQQLASAGCPWTRMKWTDAMVRLLIRVVYSVGDDGEGVATAGGAGGAAKAGPGHAAAAQQQKKGKWKSVSHAMMDKGFVVSPQQCEDKFNDLNKRYKRVVDLLGRGRACRVVENHALLDAIDELTPKAKNEARKLLSSKHLFFREMCAYHNSIAAAGSNLPPHGGGGAAGDTACLHHPPPAPVAAAASSAARYAHAQQHAAPSPQGMKDSSTDVADDSDDAMSDNGDEDEDEEEEDGPVYRSRRPRSRQHSGGRGKRGRGMDGAASEDLEDEADGGGGRRSRTAAAPDPSAILRQLKSELAAATAAAMDPQQARSWVRRRAVEVEEQQIVLESHAYYLERQRLKWERFRASKERDMERSRLQNDRLRIESRRLLLMLRHKDVDLDMAEANSSSVDHHTGASPLAAHQQQPIGSSPSPSTAGHPN
ncbi:hypothetical protein Zm00014a_028459 [Zea mays]|uniref:Myb/SANT-like DNA-binding domain-containing protein n=1 Tax=Zea mays TaxID=4577 RepID=A0A3L6FJJ3_MAIZE|nr:hypothetical protein Zm00014a_028459 [Zea mays]